MTSVETRNSASSGGKAMTRLYRVRTRSSGTTAWRITDTPPTPELLECLEFEPLNVGPDFWWGVRNGLGLSVFCWIVIGGFFAWLP